MSSPISTAALDSAYVPAPRKRGRWKWFLAVAIAILLVLMWRCGSALYEGQGLSYIAVATFHTHLNSGEFEDICNEADEGFASRDKRDELLRVLEAVHRKLGEAGATNLTNININATTNGTFLSANFATAFAQGEAREEFIWKKSGRTLKLYRYNVVSSAFLK